MNITLATVHKNSESFLIQIERNVSLKTDNILYQPYQILTPAVSWWWLGLIERPNYTVIMKVCNQVDKQTAGKNKEYRPEKLLKYV